MSEVIIDDVVYVPKMAIGTMRIVVLDRWFVYVGEVEELNDRIYIHNARSIIRWGTTKHLAELVNGPLEHTRLGNACKVEVFKSSVIHQIEVNIDAWG